MCGRKTQKNIGWTGKETVRDASNWQECCDICKKDAFEEIPCIGWVYFEHGDCYSKYLTDENYVPVHLDAGNGVMVSSGFIDRESSKIIYILDIQLDIFTFKYKFSIL